MRWAVTMGVASGALFLGHMALAQTSAASLRPELRPDRNEVSRAGSIPILAIPTTSVLRPQLRPTAVVERAPPRVDSSAKDAAFQQWLGGMRARAGAQGISGATFDRAFRGVRYDPDVIKRDRNQSEFSKTIWEYLDCATSDTRVANGRCGGTVSCHAECDRGPVRR